MRSLLLSLLLVPSLAFAAPFSDVPESHPNAEAIAYVKQQGIVEGYVDGTFKPDATINRAEFVKIIEYAILGHPPRDFEPECYGVTAETFNGTNAKWSLFPDVREDDWFALPLCAAWKDGIIGGYPDGTFKPAASINFAEAAKILTNTFDIAAPGMAQGDAWYKPYVMSLERANAIPTSIASFDALITRGEMAEMIYRLKVENVEKPSQTYEDLNVTSPYFHPDTVQVGQKYGGMVVTVNDGQIEDVIHQKIRFEGRVTLEGTYHDLRGSAIGPDNSICMNDWSDASKKLLPIVGTDNRVCLKGDAAMFAKFPVRTSGRATIVIDAYDFNRYSEVSNMANVIDVLDVEATEEIFPGLYE